MLYESCCCCYCCCCLIKFSPSLSFSLALSLNPSFSFLPLIISSFFSLLFLIQKTVFSLSVSLSLPKKLKLPSSNDLVYLIRNISIVYIHNHCTILEFVFLSTTTTIYHQTLFQPSICQSKSETSVSFFKIKYLSVSSYISCI